MQNNYGHNLYHDLMTLVNEADSPFYHVDHVMNGETFRIFNYRLASYSDFLKPNALEARGIMFRIDSNGNYLELAALTPAKFFNYRENPLVMDVDFSKTDLIMDKVDGSIMTTFMLPISDTIYLKSKTSLTSEQANAANDFLRSGKADMLFNYLMYMHHAGYSVTLEYTSPLHRIILPYQEVNLTVLSARDRSNGKHVPYDILLKDMEEFHCAQHLVKDYSKSISPERLQDFIDNIRFEKDKEGYVIYADGIYTKHKTDQYISLHKSKVSINSDRNLFEAVVMEAHDDLRSLFADDAFTLNRIDKIETLVKNLFNDIENNVVDFYHTNSHLDRKNFAIKAQAEVDKRYFSLVMNLYMNLYFGKPNDYREWMIKHYRDFNISDNVSTDRSTSSRRSMVKNNDN